MPRVDRRCSQCGSPLPASRAALGASATLGAAAVVAYAVLAGPLGVLGAALCGAAALATLASTSTPPDARCDACLRATTAPAPAPAPYRTPTAPASPLVAPVYPPPVPDWAPRRESWNDPALADAARCAGTLVPVRDDPIATLLLALASCGEADLALAVRCDPDAVARDWAASRDGVAMRDLARLAGDVVAVARADAALAALAPAPPRLVYSWSHRVRFGGSFGHDSYGNPAAADAVRAAVPAPPSLAAALARRAANRAHRGCSGLCGLAGSGLTAADLEWDDEIETS